MPREQARQLLEALANEPDAALYALELSTGLRQGELLSLRWAHDETKTGVDLERGEVWSPSSCSMVNSRRSGGAPHAACFGCGHGSSTPCAPTASNSSYSVYSRVSTGKSTVWSSPVVSARPEAPATCGCRGNNCSNVWVCPTTSSTSCVTRRRACARGGREPLPRHVNAWAQLDRHHRRHVWPLDRRRSRGRGETARNGTSWTFGCQLGCQERHEQS